jgi:chemotaxis protein methyltransferase CheR
MQSTKIIVITDEQADQLIQDMVEVYGYDFSNYAMASLKRRLQRLIVIDHLPNYQELRKRIREDGVYFAHAIEEISVSVTEMLRDPAFYHTIRTQVIPVLATYPFIKVWHAGCATGEEVFSMAILLQEAGVLHKSLLYATDINPAVLQKARRGIFPVSQMKQYSKNYVAAGGTNDFSSYYTAGDHFAQFDPRLSEKMIFAAHNLVTDNSFNSFQLIFCRNVLIYFNKDLQNRVIKLFDDSLELNGFLALGTKESIRFSDVSSNYKHVTGREKLWRKIK